MITKVVRPIFLRRNGFTIIEIVLVVLLLGILAIIALPKFSDMTEKAQANIEEMTVSSIRNGINLYSYEQHVKTGTLKYPPYLDNASSGNASSSNPFFIQVLEAAITDARWNKSGNIYRFIPTGNTYKYNNSNGKFE